MRVDFGHIEVDFLATKTRFWVSAITFLVMKVSFGSLEVDFELKKVDFGPLRVNHCGSSGVDFGILGSQFMAAKSLFQASGSLLIVEF